MNAQEQAARAEQRRINERLQHPAGGSRPIPIESEESIAAAFERVAQEFPEQVALKQGDTALTYRRLNEQANQLARAILGEIGEGDEPVGLLCESGVDAMILMLAARKAGKFFVGLDATMPLDRLGAMLVDCPVRLIVAQAKHADLGRQLAEKSSARVILSDAGAGMSGENVGRAAAPDSLFCIVYTSGTTGAPKGVMIDERAIRHRIATAANTARMGRFDHTAINHSVWFLASMGVAFAALLSGGITCFFDSRQQGHGALRDWMEQEGITIFTPAPTLFRQFAATLPDGFVFSTVRLVRLGSERSLASDFALYRKHFPRTGVLRIGYGISEASLTVEHLLDHESRVEDAVIPAGYPVKGVEMLLLDEEGREVAPGETGEIIVRARHLARGYWGQPALTAARFLPDTEDSRLRRYRTGDVGHLLPNGMLSVVGRVDAQLKVRGFRVEPVEIESALLEVPGVTAVIVVGRSDAAGQTRLIAYLVCDGTTPNVSELRAAVAKRLPDYMVPQRFVFLDAIPAFANGKVNQGALPEPSTERPEIDAPFVAPRSPLEQAVARVWESVLQLDRVGVHDPFLELGGNSIQATRIVARIQEEIGNDIDAQELLSATTVGQMAAHVQRALSAAVDANTLKLLLGE